MQFRTRTGKYNILRPNEVSHEVYLTNLPPGCPVTTISESFSADADLSGYSVTDWRDILDEIETRMKAFIFSTGHANNKQGIEWMRENHVLVDAAARESRLGELRNKRDSLSRSLQKVTDEIEELIEASQQEVNRG